jgi:inosine triphosphate pyrophosphatase
MNRKWFLAEIGHVGLNNLLAAYTDKSANAICTFAYSAGPGAEVILFEGICEVSEPYL